MKFRISLKRVIRLSGTATLLFIPLGALGDTSIVQQVKEESPAGTESSTRTVRVRGLKLRLDSAYDSKTISYIYDLETGKRYRLDPRKREVYIANLSSHAKELQGGLILEQIQISIRPTGSESEIHGVRCREFIFDLQAPGITYHARQLFLHDTGTVYISEHVHGAYELTNFVREARKRGFLSAAALFSPTDSALGAFFYGDESKAMLMTSQSKSEPESRPGPLEAAPFSQRQINTVSVKTEVIPDESFEIPSNWKVKKDPLPPGGLRIFR